MKILNFAILFALSVFLISNASAVVLTGVWSNNASSITINSGNAVSFTVDFGSMNPPVSISESLYNSNNQLVWQKSYSGLTGSYVSDVIPSSYIPAGSYQLIVNGNDAKKYPDSDTLSLTVNPTVPPANNLPVITSSPVLSVNENSSYSYDVNANDADGDTLTYSLATAPSWLSINSATGLITGTAPLVSSNTSYSITVQVSDGKGSVSQTYTLIVNNVPVIPPANNLPAITILGTNPLIIQAGFSYIDAGATASDIEDGNLTSRIITANNVNTNILGNYTVVYSVTDSANSTVTATRNVSVVDTTAPVITINGANPLRITRGGTYTEFGATATDNHDSSVSVSIDSSSVNTTSAGTYTVTYTATDSSNNTATATRTVNVVAPSNNNNNNGNTVSSVISQQSQNPNPASTQEISSPINLGGQNQSSNASDVWTSLLIVISVLVLGTLVALIIVAGRKK